MSQYPNEIKDQTQFSSPPAYPTPIVYPQGQPDAPGVYTQGQPGVPGAYTQGQPGAPGAYAQGQPAAQGGYPQGQPIPPAGISMDAAALGQAYRDQLFAECARGNHQRTTTYGICGIITAVILFPIGLICLFTDSEQKCSRCGIILK